MREGGSLEIQPWYVHTYDNASYEMKNHRDGTEPIHQDSQDEGETRHQTRPRGFKTWSVAMCRATGM